MRLANRIHELFATVRHIKNRADAILSVLERQQKARDQFEALGIPNEIKLPHPDQHYGCLSFSQHGEDMIILALFNSLGIKAPSYIDVGAHHPFSISNTALLHQRGSRGVNIEANPNLYQNFLKYRPADINLNIGIGPIQGKMTFYMVDKWSGRNSFNKSMVEEFIKEEPEFSITEEIIVPVETLSNVVAKYCDGKFPDFLSIDIEGLDEAVLASVDFKKSAPLVICVESVDAHGNDRSKKLDEILGHTFVRIIKTAGNSIYVRNNLQEKIK